MPNSYTHKQREGNKSCVQFYSQISGATRMVVLLHLVQAEKLHVSIFSTIPKYLQGNKVKRSEIQVVCSCLKFWQWSRQKKKVQCIILYPFCDHRGSIVIHSMNVFKQMRLSKQFSHSLQLVLNHGGSPCERIRSAVLPSGSLSGNGPTEHKKTIWQLPMSANCSCLLIGWSVHVTPLLKALQWLLVCSYIQAGSCVDLKQKNKI